MGALWWLLCAVFTAGVNAQGSRGGIQYPPCNAAIGQGARYYGCWDVTPAPGAPNFYNVSISNSVASTQYYPGWLGPGSTVDNSINPANCTIACRGHGYKYSALFNGNQCECGMTMTPL